MDDLIRRQDAIEALIQEFYSNVDDYISEKQAVHAIDSLPSAQLEERTKERTKKRTETHACDLIKRQDAIDALERIFDRCEEIEAHLPEGDHDRVGYKMYPDWLKVWNYLRQLPSAQPEIKTDGDTISRASAIDSISADIMGGLNYESILKKLPSAERPTGEWIKDEFGITVCSECKRPRRDSRVDHINFCNSCGARMINTK